RFIILFHVFAYLGACLGLACFTEAFAAGNEPSGTYTSDVNGTVYHSKFDFAPRFSQGDQVAVSNAFPTPEEFAQTRFSVLAPPDFKANMAKGTYARVMLVKATFISKKDISFFQ